MNHRLHRLTLTIVTLLLLASTIANAQSPKDPTDLKISTDPKGVRLSWTAAPGTGNRYLVEQAGPGYTLYTQIGGPIEATNLVVERPDVVTRCQTGVTNYTYRVRTIDAALRTSGASNVVSTSAMGAPPCNLPLVGTNVLDLIRLLPGVNNPCQPNLGCTAFTMTGVKDRTVSFNSDFSGETFSWGCSDCSFIVNMEGIGPAKATSRGIVFKVSPDGTEVFAACRTVKCEVFISGGSTQKTLAENESIAIPVFQRTTFSVYMR